MNRGSRRWNIFLDDDDRQLFLRLLGRASERFDVSVIAYALMGNHYHLALICHGPALSEVMHWLGSRYVALFNRRHGFDGTLFRSRFSSVEIASDDQLLTTVRYVHRNPLDLDSRADLANYPWSSHGAYLGWARPPEWLKKEVVLDQFPNSCHFQDFVETSLPHDAVQTTTRSRKPLALAPTNASFVDSEVMSIADVQRAVARVAEVEVRHTNSPVGAAARRARRVALLLCADELLLQPRQLADALGFPSPGATSTALSRARRLIATDGEFADLVQRSRQQLKT